jgi:hypothetical protein
MPSGAGPLEQEVELLLPASFAVEPMATFQ